MTQSKAKPVETGQANTTDWWSAWVRFWFSPTDPTLLGFIRFWTGVMVFYTWLCYCYFLMEAVGPHAWSDLQHREKIIRDTVHYTSPLFSHAVNIDAAWDIANRDNNPVAKAYLQELIKNVNRQTRMVYLPLPKSKEQSELLLAYQKQGQELLVYGLPLPETPEQFAYARKFLRDHGTPPAQYPRNAEHALQIELNIASRGLSAAPGMPASVGQSVWSIWFHVTDPTYMWMIHIGFLIAALCFTVGFCTRVTSAIVWFGVISYIQRNPTIQFGADTMMTILTLYLMIGPSGAALSVDRLISRWWVKNKTRVVNAWGSLFRRGDRPVAPPTSYTESPAPSIMANFAIRLLQVHLCIIYLAAGLSKLQGNMWWTGEAAWGTLANPEFAPMHNSVYAWFIAQLCKHDLIYNLVITGGTYFTLAFEIAYAFLIWRPSLRWWLLFAAFLLHGFIGAFMGLVTFSLIMVVMNLVFLTNAEVRWLLSWVMPSKAAPSTDASKTAEKEPATSAAPS